MIPATTTRVEQHTDEESNACIRRQTERNISQVAKQGDGDISRRLEELDQEWDVERTLEANAASISLLGLGLGAFVDRRFFLLPAGGWISAATCRAGMVSSRSRVSTPGRADRQ